MTSPLVQQGPYIGLRAEKIPPYGGLGYGAILKVAYELAQEKMSPLTIIRRLLRILTHFEGWKRMSKRELIDYICRINKTAKPEFLAGFSEEELNDYLEHLMELDLEELVVCS